MSALRRLRYANTWSPVTRRLSQLLDAATLIIAWIALAKLGVDWGLDTWGGWICLISMLWIGGWLWSAAAARGSAQDRDERLRDRAEELSRWRGRGADPREYPPPL